MSVKLPLVLYGLGNSAFFQRGFTFAFPRHLEILPTQYYCKLNSYLFFVLWDHTNMYKFKLQTCTMLGLCCECSGKAFVYFFILFTQSQCWGRKISSTAPFEGWIFLFSLCSSLRYLSGALDDLSHAKHENGKSRELAHNLLVDFPRITSAFRELIYSLDSCSHFLFGFQGFSLFLPADLYHWVDFLYRHFIQHFRGLKMRGIFQDMQAVILSEREHTLPFYFYLCIWNILPNIKLTDQGTELVPWLLLHAIKFRDEN